MAFRNPESRFGFFLIPTLAICFFAFCYMQTGRADIRYELRVAVCATWISIATLVLLLIFFAIKNRFRFQIQTLFELTMVVAIILAGFSAQTFLQKRLTKLEAKQERLTRLYRRVTMSPTGFKIRWKEIEISASIKADRRLNSNLKR